MKLLTKKRKFSCFSLVIFFFSLFFLFSFFSVLFLFIPFLLLFSFFLHSSFSLFFSFIFLPGPFSANKIWSLPTSGACRIADILQACTYSQRLRALSGITAGLLFRKKRGQGAQNYSGFRSMQHSEYLIFPLIVFLRRTVGFFPT